MRPDREADRERHARNLRTGRELAQRLAAEAERIATTLDELAVMHESLAGSAGHPLSVGAAERAVVERRLAARERVASAWFDSIADGSTPAPTFQRLPSQ